MECLGIVATDQLAHLAGERILFADEVTEVVDGKQLRVFYEYLPATLTVGPVFLRRVRNDDPWGAWSAPRSVAPSDVPDGLFWRACNE